MSRQTSRRREPALYVRILIVVDFAAHHIVGRSVVGRGDFSFETDLGVLEVVQLTRSQEATSKKLGADGENAKAEMPSDGGSLIS